MTTPSHERDVILDAALRAISTHRQHDPGVHDILRMAGVSGRTLYSHFPSKDALYVALFRREFHVGLAWIAARTEHVDDPVERTKAWIDAYLDWYFTPEQRERARIVTSDPIARAVGYNEEANRCRSEVTAVLAQSLTQATELDRATSSDPVHDASSIRAIIDAVCDDLAVSQPMTDRAAAKAHVKRFAWGAVGISV